jgi:hypothetical protein
MLCAWIVCVCVSGGGGGGSLQKKTWNIFTYN